MSQTLADMDIAKAGNILKQCGPADMYDYMADFGDKYAVLANGVARGDSLAGNAALRHMQAIAAKNGKTLSGQDIDKIRSDMATAYLDVRADKHKYKDYTQLTAEDAQTFHRSVFEANKLPAKAWTLEVPFDMRGPKASETLWQDILDSAGNSGKEKYVSAKLSAEMMAIFYGLAANPWYPGASETLSDVGEWTSINVMSLENIKEAVMGSSSPEERPECIIEETTLDAEEPVPLQAPAPLGEALQKRSYTPAFIESNPAPANSMNRLIEAYTPLEDALWAVSITGREALSSLYHFTVRFKSDSADLDCQKMIGEPCAVQLETDRRDPRYLSGQMIDFAAIGHEGRH